ncbi:hypothetical protein BDR06DRAFT_960141 [Suillus hirtellus]|nr:hypothetical protein BDR06DRAFT_960141 [Suillus hirtellus]
MSTSTLSCHVKSRNEAVQTTRTAYVLVTHGMSVIVLSLLRKRRTAKYCRLFAAAISSAEYAISTCSR